jgi:hypothetical protein
MASKSAIFGFTFWLRHWLKSAFHVYSSLFGSWKVRRLNRALFIYLCREQWKQHHHSPKGRESKHLERNAKLLGLDLVRLRLRNATFARQLFNKFARSKLKQQRQQINDHLARLIAYIRTSCPRAVMRSD